MHVMTGTKVLEVSRFLKGSSSVRWDRKPVKDLRLELPAPRKT